MKTFRSALGIGAMCLLLSCTSVACSGPKEGGTDLVLSGNQLFLNQGDSTKLTVRAGMPDKIEGERNGVVVAIEEGRFITVTVEKEAKVGKVEITVKNKEKAGKSASFTVTVSKAPANEVTTK